MTGAIRTGGTVLRGILRMNMGLSGKHTVRDNGYWSWAEEVKGTAFPEDS